MLHYFSLFINDYVIVSDPEQFSSLNTAAEADVDVINLKYSLVYSTQYTHGLSVEYAKLKMTSEPSDVTSTCLALDDVRLNSMTSPPYHVLT